MTPIDTPKSPATPPPRGARRAKDVAGPATPRGQGMLRRQPFNQPSQESVQPGPQPRPQTPHAPLANGAEKKSATPAKTGPAHRAPRQTSSFMDRAKKAAAKGLEGRSPSPKHAVTSKNKPAPTTKDLAKMAATKAAANGIASVTGIPPSIVEKGLKHWKILLAGALIAASLPIIVIIGMFSSLSGSATAGQIAACGPITVAGSTTSFQGSTAAGTTASLSTLTVGQEVTVIGTQSLNTFSASQVDVGSATQAITTQQQVVEGKVTSVNTTGSSFVLQETTGATITVNVVTATTSGVSTTSPTAGAPNATDLATFLAALRWQESRDNYQDESAGATWDLQYKGDGQAGLHGDGGAFGAYQFIQTTWYADALSAGYASYANINPATLSPTLAQTVQDAVATSKVLALYKNAELTQYPGNIWKWVAEAWFYPADANPSDQSVVPAPGNPTMEEYGDGVTQYMTSQPWATSSTTSSQASNASGNAQQCPTEVSGPLATRIVAIAEATLGETQAQGGWGANNEAWCSIYATWVWRTAGVSPAVPVLPYSGDPWKWVANNGGLQLDPTATPSPGDMVFFEDPDFPLSDGYDHSQHVAIVTQVDPNGDIEFIGGNEGPGDNNTTDVEQSFSVDPADTAQYGWPRIWGYAQPPGL